MSNIFSKIVEGKIPCYQVAEDRDHLAFLDISPLVRGHVLVIPKKTTDYIFDIEDSEYLAFWEFTQHVARKMKRVLDCKRIGVAVIGLEVSHAHIHLVPINSVEDINFSAPKLSLSKNEMQEIASKIRKSI